MTASDRPEEHYDRVTRAWRYLLGEDLHYGFFGDEDETLERATRRLSEEMARHCDLGDGLDVIDVGCGIGTPALYLAQTFGAAVTGITISAVGVEIGRANAAESGLAEKVRFVQADAMDNGLPDASFDRAWVMESSHLMPDKPKMIAECGRVLRPGGRLVLCDIITHLELPLSEVLAHAKEFNLLRQVFGRAKMATLSAYQQWCEEAGFAAVQTVDISTEVARTFDCWEQNAREHEHEVTELIGRDSLDAFSASCSVLRQLWAKKILGYGLVIADRS